MINFIKRRKRKIMWRRVSSAFEPLGFYSSGVVSPSPSLRGRRGAWESVIGLEIHAQISSETKLFSSGRTPQGGYQSPVNTCASFFDAALPGTLPILNQRCVEAGIQTALALGCTLNLISNFDRKHYFYADLPSGYQITQSRLPLAVDGSVAYWVIHPDLKPFKTVAPIIQLQLEMDSGKSLHDDQDKQSLIDLNRCGVGLMEIVFGPSLSGGEEAVSLVKELSSIMTKIGSCSCKMEEGALRVDANISVHRPGTQLGTRTEVKNLNSTKALYHAIEYEVERQINILESGGSVINETLGFDSENRKTISMREKESKLDYRFMPEPNLLPLKLKDSLVERECSHANNDFLDVDYFRKNLPPLPEELRKDLIEQYGIDISIINFVINEPVIYKYYAESLKYGVENVKVLISILTTSIQELLKKGHNLEEDSSLTPEILASIANAKYNKTYSYQALNKSLTYYLENQNLSIPLKDLIERNGWDNRDEDPLLDKIMDEILSDNYKKVQKYLNGKDKEWKGIIFNIRKKYKDHESLDAIIEGVQRKLTEQRK